STLPESRRGFVYVRFLGLGSCADDVAKELRGLEKGLPAHWLRSNNNRVLRHFPIKFNLRLHFGHYFEPVSVKCDFNLLDVVVEQLLLCGYMNLESFGVYAVRE